MKNNLLKLFVNAIALIGISQFAQAQVPPNNSCFNAAVLTVNAPCTNGNNTNATLDGPATQGCWASVPNNDVWYTFTTGAAGNYTVTTDNGTNTDTQIKLYSGGCGGLTLVGCNDDVGANGLYTLASVATASLAASTQYWVQVDNYGTGSTSFCIALRFAGNDNCANATSLTVNGGCVIGSNYGATIESGENIANGCWLGTPGPNATVWYSFTTPAGAPTLFTVSTNNGTPNTDTQIKIYSGACGALTEVACNEDGNLAPNTLAAITSATLSGSTTYYVQVDLYQNEIGSFCISVSYVPNDNCANSIPLTVGAPCTNGSNFNATTELGENTSAGCWTDLGPTPVDHTVWYTFTTSATGEYMISTDNGGTFDSQLKLYTSCGSLVVIACDDDGGIVNDFSSVICATLPATTTYYIQVDGWADVLDAGAMGTFCISVNAILPLPDCINDAIDITSLISPVNNSTNPFDCNHNYVYSYPGSCASATIQNVLGDPNYCNGSSTPIVYTPYPNHYDIWFKFTVSSGMLANDYLHLFPLNANPPFLAMALFGETVPGTPPTSTCPGGDISGLTYIDCSSPDVIYLPPPPDPTQGQDGGARDEGACSTPIHARIDISNLTNGTYY
ncbi:MAG TPA: PPC domain-containing protein, partial [Bacteroidia bacterium]|nr:PPC domain-containing protein [Bacteroidia bacterium]